MKNYTKKYLKASNGITLIALVITIIVLLILAGISISMLSGDNGILQKATDAKEQTGIGQEKEIVTLAYSSALAKKVGSGDSTAITSEDINAELTNQGATASGSNPITVTFDSSKRQYTINTTDGIIDYAGIKSDDITTGKTVSELYDGINNASEQDYNEDAMHIGDWVEYDAGNWAETKETPNWDTYADPSLEFGGYTAGQSRNTNASGIFGESGEKYEGWRIFDISANTITLISAGCPEGYWDTAGNAYNTEKIFTGNTTGNIRQERPSTPRDWSIYENNYAIGNTARVIRKNDLDNWYNKYIDSIITDLYEDYEKIYDGYWDDVNQEYIEPRNMPTNSENKLISVMNNRFAYLFPDYTMMGGYPCSFNKIKAESTNISWNDGEDDGVYGIRILLNLKSDIKFNETPSKLQKDGFSYNKWSFSE